MIHKYHHTIVLYGEVDHEEDAKMRRPNAEMNSQESRLL